ncbi:hypothetical protein HYPSUDRAFT_211665 [Hypholoma sublateritium FD-334 SS-4]|uniref:Uncharacterized protein n=1 Tax=Hypholoma sublateritium (strain FD-334 SS-4) TaxID=945553 RepID=A0A0D2MWC8_HYPSF|nr:hypothetical protein HYPSUDRAFT_211665 [Hypholoma sublateritium FD-334 SS-4]
MSDNIQHAPALKVGGRRLSISAKHKSPVHAAPSSVQTENKDNIAADDYPRPTAPTGDAPLQQNHQHEEEVPPQKERKEKKLQETAHWKTETTRPTRDSHVASNIHGCGMRISQPAGKSLGV